MLSNFLKQFFRKAFNNFRGEGQKWIAYKKKKCVQAGLRIANFIDVQFNLIRGTYQPHSKPDNTPVYINKKSNHPPLVLKQLPKSIAKRMSDISSNFFSNSIPTCSEALNKIGFNDALIHTSKTTDCDTSEQKKKSKIWSNPGISLNVKINVWKTFLKLARRNFREKFV